MRFDFFKKAFQKIDQLVTGRGRIDEALFEELEETLIQSDINIHTTGRLLKVLREAVQDERMIGSDQVMARLKAELTDILAMGGSADRYALKVGEKSPTVYLIVGVNGVGKTTTIAKLAYNLTQQKKHVILAAGDTFRAAAIDQLEIWSHRVGTELIKHKEGSDPASVVYDAIKAAKARHAD